MFLKSLLESKLLVHFVIIVLFGCIAGAYGICRNVLNFVVTVHLRATITCFFRPQISTLLYVHP